MRNNRIYHKSVLICCFLVAVVLSGCVDVVDIHNHSGETQKLVLYARLCPQLDSTYIMLSNTQLLYSGSSGSIRNLDDGVVELSDDGSHWVPAHFDSLHKRYLITREEFPVEEGHTYYIRASHNGFPDVSASCTVPVAHNVGFRFDTVATENDSHWGEIYNWPHKDVYVEWHDVPGEENFYGMKAYELWTHYPIYPDGEEEDYFWGFSRIWLTEGNKDLEYVSDEGHDGELMRYLFAVDIFDEEYYDDWKGKGYRKAKGGDDDETQYYLLFLDKGSYLYETTLWGDNELNFLMLEPPHTYTNIEGGFGLFGGFSMLPVP